MPVAAEPERPCFNHRLIVEAQRHNGSPPYWLQSYDMSSTIGPGKVVGPTVLAWVKQRNKVARQMVEGMGTVALELITAVTRGGEIASFVCTTDGPGNDVVNHERYTRHPPRRLAVLATVTSFLEDLSA